LEVGRINAGQLRQLGKGFVKESACIMSAWAGNRLLGLQPRLPGSVFPSETPGISEKSWSETMEERRGGVIGWVKGSVRKLLRRFIFLSDSARSFVNVYADGADGEKHLLMQTIAFPTPDRYYKIQNSLHTHRSSRENRSCFKEWKSLPKVSGRIDGYNLPV
jgi:hypothetical protein